MQIISSHILDEINLYLGGWRDESLRYISTSKGRDLDLATSIFVATSLTTSDELKDIGLHIVERPSPS